jgi:Xaa-Pro aminopeptidase
MRHEVPIWIGDPFLYAEVGGRSYMMTWSLERALMTEARPDAELIDIADLGFYELLGSRRTFDEVSLELISGMAAQIEVKDAIVDFEFPLGVAERLRADGITLTVDDARVKARRRVKSGAELEGIRRAQRAADVAIGAAGELLASARARDGVLHVDGRPLLAETVRRAMRDACWELGALLPGSVIVASVWQGYGHEAGTGPLPAGLPIQIDVWPQDEPSACWADMTRTFVAAAPPPDEVRRQEALVRDAIESVRAAVRPGISGRELHGLASDVFEAAGYRTQRTGPGDDRSEGFQFSLGHGVGLEVHEDPALGLVGHAPLVSGDVLAIEPGLWDREVGGVRLEDLVLVTEDGCETLTNYSYEIDPRQGASAALGPRLPQRR